MTIDLDRIANLAEGASGSPDGDVIYIGQDPPGAASDARAELVAALSPDVVLRLVAVCRCAKAYLAADSMMGEYLREGPAVDGGASARVR